MKHRVLLLLGTLFGAPAILSCGSPAGHSPGGRSVTLSNRSLPKDTAGNDLVTGEASVLAWGGAYYVYFNDWGSCPGVDCCSSPLGCADCCFSPPSAQYPDTCVYADGHTVVVYRTTDFQTWEPQGVALPACQPQGRDRVPAAGRLPGEQQDLPHVVRGPMGRPDGIRDRREPDARGAVRHHRRHRQSPRRRPDRRLLRLRRRRRDRLPRAHRHRHREAHRRFHRRHAATTTASSCRSSKPR